ncbi:MAG: FkbM family methyltransferase [Gemmataceae bacterium]
MATGYRPLFYVAVVIATCALGVCFLYSRKATAAAEEAERRNEVNPFAMSLHKTRDREFAFTVENYGYVYRGTTGELIDDAVLTFGAWEKFILFFMEDYTAAAKTQDTAFIDVGANTGQYALFMAPRTKEVHAIEPFPPVLKRLDANLALNKFPNVTVHRVGFGEAAAEIPFFASDETNAGGGTFRPDDPDKKPFGALKIVAADEYFKTHPTAPVGIVKMDIEGYEEPALKGLRATMERDRPLVIVEVTTEHHPVKGSIRSYDQLKALFPANYEFLSFHEAQQQFVDGRYDVRPFPADEAARFFASEKQRNLIAVPAEKLSVVPRSRAK